VNAQVGAIGTIQSVTGDVGIHLDELTVGSPEDALTRLRIWLRSHGHQSPDHALLTEFLRQLRESSRDSHPRLDCGELVLQRYRDGVYFVPRSIPPFRGEPLFIVPEQVLTVPAVGDVSVLPAPAPGLSLARGERLVLRWRQGGERCYLPGRTGSRSLKGLLQEWGVPPWWRDRIPLLYLDDELLAVGDLVSCQSSRFRATAQDQEPLWRLNWQRPFDTGSR
jgi:tRNA(Ile)-lysidine synthase